MAGRRGMLLGLLRRDGGELCLVDRDEFLIGRARDCDLPLELAAVSRRHVLIRRDADGYTIEDLQSPGGTFVNGVNIGGAHRLKNRDHVLFGNAQLRVLELDYIAREGEIGGPLECHATYTCREVACAIEIRLRTSTSHDKLERELDAAVLRSMREASATDDPVAVVLSARDALARLREPVAGTGVSAQVMCARFDADALVLLRDPSEASNAAWSWLHEQRLLSDLVEADRPLVGLEYRRTETDEMLAMPAELLAPALRTGPGLFLWIRIGGLGQLVRVTAPIRLVASRPTVAIDIAHARNTWTLVHQGVHEVLAVGMPIAFPHDVVVTPVAIQNPTET